MTVTEIVAQVTDDCAVLILRDDLGEDDEFLPQLVTELRRHLQRPPLVVALAEGVTIEALDEDEMRAAGWVRADAGIDGNHWQQGPDPARASLTNEEELRNWIDQIRKLTIAVDTAVSALSLHLTRIPLMTLSLQPNPNPKEET